MLVLSAGWRRAVGGWVAARSDGDVGGLLHPVSADWVPTDWRLGLGVEGCIAPSSSYEPTRLLCDVHRVFKQGRWIPVIIDDLLPCSKVSCYALSGTDIACGAIVLRACYAVPGTEIAFSAIVLCACYAIPSTEIAY
eukprot:437916-Rhodomonas_salina.2